MALAPRSPSIPRKSDRTKPPANGSCSGSGGGGSGGGTGGASGTGGTNNDTPADGNAAPNIAGIEELENDPEFQAKLAEMMEKYPGLTKEEIYRTIQGESNFNSTAVAGSGATGLFQFMPGTANDLGYTTAQIQAMTPAQQLSVYDQYLDKNNYQGGSLGIMQAAPAYANKPGNFEVYGVGTPAWNQNPGWRGPDGRITVDSINAYYDKQG